MRARPHTRTHTLIHSLTHTRTHPLTYTHMRTADEVKVDRLSQYAYPNMTKTMVRVFVCACVCARVCVCARACVCVCAGVRVGVTECVLFLVIQPYPFEAGS